MLLIRRIQKVKFFCIENKFDVVEEWKWSNNGHGHWFCFSITFNLHSVLIIVSSLGWSLANCNKRKQKVQLLYFQPFDLNLKKSFLI